MSSMFLRFLLVAILTSRAWSHAYLMEPASRNLLEHQSGNENCPHCMQSGGPGAVLARGTGIWPTISDPGSHGLCGDPRQHSPEPASIADMKYMEPSDPQATYVAGSIVELKVYISTHHQGHFEYRICDQVLDRSLASAAAGQQCLNAHLLLRAPRLESCGNNILGDCQPINPDHPERWYLPPSNGGSEDYVMRYVVPQDLACERCTMQWFWATANSCAYDEDYFTFDPGFKFFQGYESKSTWATCSNTCCGLNNAGYFGEEFWNCADVKIIGASTSVPTVPPTAEPTTTPVLTTTPLLTTTPVPTEAPTTATPTGPTTAAPTSEAPTTELPTTQAPTTDAPTTEACTYSMEALCTSCEMSGPEKWNRIIGTGWTLEQCKEECLQRSDCHAIDFGKYGQAGECYVNSGNTRGRAHNNFDAWVKKCQAPTTEAPTTEALTTEVPTTVAPTSEAPTTELPTTEAPTTDAPTTEAPTTELHNGGDEGAAGGLGLGAIIGVGVVIGGLCGLSFVVVRYLRKVRRRSGLTPKGSCKSTETLERVKLWTRGFGFWFVDADKIKESTGPLPPYQELKKMGGWLTKHTIRMKHCLLFVLVHHVAVSHVWLTRDDPDPRGEQADALRIWLLKNPHVKYVWLDWCSLPQGQRTEAEKKEFKSGLKFVNLVYLAPRVLKILDGQYIGRFWPQFEAWLSYQRVVLTSVGLEPNQSRSDEIFTGVAARMPNERTRLTESVRERWGDKNIDEATNLLTSSDLLVTNESDKHVCLEAMQDLVKAIGAVMENDQDMVIMGRSEQSIMEGEVMQENNEVMAENEDMREMKSWRTIRIWS